MELAFLYLMIYSCLGWACESIYVSVGRKKLINSGFLHGPFCPIYGFGAIFVIYLLEPFAYSPILVFLLGVLITSTLEYFTSWLMEMLFHVMWWDYSHYKYNINGRVCLLNSFLFGVMSLIVIYLIHPTIASFIEALPETLIHLTASILLIYLITDTILSTVQLINFKQQLLQFEKAIEEIKTALAVQLPDFNTEIKELREQFEDNHPELNEFKNRVQEKYADLKSNRQQLRLRHAFPDLKLTRKSQYHRFIESIKKTYNEKANQ